jgi:uncharacterized peroxidase-related enzyme
MAHIGLKASAPGIVGLLKSFPETAKPLSVLAETLLTRGTPAFPVAERESVAHYVSYLNGCVFCSESHAAVADAHGAPEGSSRKIWQDLEAAPISERLRAYLRIAGKVQRVGSRVEPSEIARALELGATEHDVHDVVLIAAAFCMYNRYVDGLATFAPPRGDPAYRMMGQMIAKNGYLADL